MIWGETKEARVRRADAIKERFGEQWFCWFAWHPISLEDGRKVWLQRVARKKGYYGVAWDPTVACRLWHHHVARVMGAVIPGDDDA